MKGRWMIASTSVCTHADVRYFADEKRAIACMHCGRLFGHLDEAERVIPHNPGRWQTAQPTAQGPPEGAG